jgi:ATP-dependent RNA circularization protein (DNA/RNA ligase family)
MGPIGCSEMAGKENPYALHYNSEQEDPIYAAA